ncbi:glycosyltransferase 87 family protein [Salinispora fenicalii]|uniref:glycosyltransferase 87 family protein n=1 Tax=Salinispora fenicalii TaxID=1137263 RepID=UPI000484DD2A|nr:glycosyltransferase 87 family protein [Salinispora fenicalii]
MTDAPTTGSEFSRTPPATPLAATAASRATLVGVIALLATAAALVHHSTGRFWGDLAAYRTGAAAAAAGDGNLYQVAYRGADGIELGFTYPPFAALLLRPLAAIPAEVAVGLWTAASVAALVAVVRLTLNATGVEPGRRRLMTLLAVLAVLPIFPVTGHLQAGQVGLFLLWMVLYDLLPGRTSRWGGVGIGVAAGLKLTPLIFVGFLLFTGRIRAAVTAMVGFLATIGIGFAWRPTDSAWFFGGGLLDTARVTGDPRTILNQSLAGALARITDTPDVAWVWAVTAVVVAAAGMALAVWCARAADQLVAVLACAGTGLLVSPVSWHHHWVWWVPALVLLAERCRRHGHRLGAVTLGVVWLVLVASTSWVLAAPGGWDLHFTGLGLVYSNLYVLMALAGLVLLTGWLSRRNAATAERGRDYFSGPPDGFRIAAPE